MQGIRCTTVIIIEEVKKNQTRMDMKRKRIFKFLPLLLLVAGAVFVASCSSDDDSAIKESEGMSLSGTIYLLNDDKYVFIGIGGLFFPNETGNYRYIETVVIPKDEFPLEQYQSGDNICFSIVGVKSTYPKNAK